MSKTQERLQRSNGVIMPIFSIPSPYGIGTFGKAAYDVVDFISDASLKYWQILPLGQTSYGDSPYQSFSSFAGNPYFVDLDMLIEDGFLKEDDLDNLNFGDNDRYVDYAIQYNLRYRILKKAYENSKGKLDNKIKEFRKKEAYWIEDYAMFMAIKHDNLDISWVEWDDKLRDRDTKALDEFRKKHKDDIDFYVFIQYEFFIQWGKLKDYANRRNIDIIGDLPIYVAFDSCDAWVNSEILAMDEVTKKALIVGGAPPDAYSEDGQLWGNPVYNWDKVKETSYDFWEKRIGMALRTYDLLRLDHFRGFEKYYAIPATDENAKFGSWEIGGGYEFFDHIMKKYPDRQFIAEDLGYITKEVDDLKDYYGFPGMNVIQFAFNENFDSNYLPHNYERNSVVYASTHDSSTLKGWLDNLDEEELSFVTRYFGLEEDDDYLWEIIRALMASVSDVAMYQIQDFFEMGDESKINSPSTLGINWKWRSKEEDFTDELAEKIKEMSRLYGRYNG
ncbi:MULTISPECIES: 4-alpha-glucanotransferase [Anaerococcus]|uniref:4-alpha-glucanotransferase n=1 Tax=Anaerococcus TaxID=165779 RepID=UPI001AE6E139|nr:MULTISPECIES: 4-alpha-glucanotransferase [Anaerococcus]MBP2068874.1 4-alpha-glucanotransferase [Anaerococcus nagyae]MDU2566011.1 4-alpha-glucanotransferase [Anaerococcus sp.]